jgi:hypothetical protein
VRGVVVGQGGAAEEVPLDELPVAAKQAGWNFDRIRVAVALSVHSPDHCLSSGCPSPETQRLFLLTYITTGAISYNCIFGELKAVLLACIRCGLVVVGGSAVAVGVVVVGRGACTRLELQ